MLPQITFIVLSAVALFSAILVITRRNPVHSAMALIVTLLSIGGFYLLLHAEFVFAVQVILYVGGIMVLYLFVVMLVNLDVAAKQAQFGRQWMLGLFTVAVLSAELGYVFYRQRGSGFQLAPSSAIPAPVGNTQAIGLALYQDYMLPVEIASIMLLVAMVGAVIMAKRKLN
jgi:NADH-quinone oxidoreductase subunit J